MRREIELLLGESVAGARTREDAAFKALMRPTDGSVVLFGAGKLGRLCARALGSAGIRLRAFCDNNRALVGATVTGVPVMQPADAAAAFGADSLFCVSIWTGAAHESMFSRLEALRQLGCRHVSTYAPLVWTHGQGEVPFHSFDLPSATLARGAGALLRLAGALADDESLGVLRDALKQRLQGVFADRTPAPDQYFASGIVNLGGNEAFVDGGAYDGDTLDEFLRRTAGRFGAYHAFEPDPANLAALESRIAKFPGNIRSRVAIHASGLYSRAGSVGFAEGGGVGSGIDSRAESTIRVETLDAALTNAPLTFLKLDIEGAELEALKGARNQLRHCQPKLAVCVYHKPDDLWTIPEFIRDVLPRHRLYLRQHGWDGWEIVLYAVP